MAAEPTILRIVEEDGDVLHAVVQTADELVTIMANVTREPTRLVLSLIHAEGEGLTRAIIRQAAKELCKHEGAGEVLLRGGVMTSGANPGGVPTPILVRVER